MEKQFLYDAVEAARDLLLALSDRIWHYAELSMREYQSAADYCALLKEQGFAVEENLCGIPTAFLGRYGSSGPVIGLLGEFDALDGLSQEAAVAEHRPRASAACGHGCGHNMLGAASLGAALAVKEAIAAGKLRGTVVFYGCPGEEGCSGKAFMARDGMFRDLDAALTWHPADVNEVTVGSCAASLQTEYVFTGVAAHAAGAPDSGRSALDAAELMNVGVQFLREHMPPKCSVHYAFLDTGGVSPNVVQSTAKLVYMVRGEDVRRAKALLSRVDDIARGAALMTGTQMTLRRIDGTSSTLSNTVLEALLYRNLQDAPLPRYTPEEWALAQAVKDTYPTDSLPGANAQWDPLAAQAVEEQSDNGKKPLNDFVVPYTPGKPYTPGSTDVGDVSWLTPTAQFTAVTFASGSPGHSWQNVSLGNSSIGQKGLLYAAKVLAAAAAELMEDPALLSAARAEFTRSSAAGYDCPIDPDVKPSV